MTAPTVVAVSPRTYEALKDSPLPNARPVVLSDDFPSFDPTSATEIEVAWRRQWDRTKWVTTALDRLPALRWCHTDTAGVDRLPLDQVGRRHIQLTNARGAHTPAVAEWALGAILLASKNLDRTVLDQAARQWSPHDDDLLLQGQTVCILGLGDIGRHLARVCLALGMHVVGVSRSGRPVPGVDRVRSASESWKELLADASVLVNCLPLTPETADSVDLSVLSRLGRPGVFVNVGRGETVVEQDLLTSVRSGVIRRAVLDTVRVEPLPYESPIWEAPEIVVSPHMSAFTDATELRTRELFVEELDRYRNGAELRNVIDLERRY